MVPNPDPHPIELVARESADELRAMARRVRAAIGDERSDRARRGNAYATRLDELSDTLRGYAGRV